MGINVKSFIRLTLLLLPAMGVILSVSTANGQTISSSAAQDEVTTAVNSAAHTAATPNVPVFTDYRGIRIGMSADEVRAKLDRLKKDKGQDLLVFSEHESAQIYYDENGKVTAISIDYFNNSNAPAPEAVLGVGIQAKPDGSMYQLSRYPAAGY